MNQLYKYVVDKTQTVTRCVVPISSFVLSGFFGETISKRREQKVTIRDVNRFTSFRWSL